MCYLRQKWIVIGGILVIGIVSNEDHLDLSHVIFLVHLERAPVDDLLDSGLVRTGIVFVFIDIVINLI